MRWTHNSLSVVIFPMFLFIIFIQIAFFLTLQILGNKKEELHGFRNREKIKIKL